MKTGMAPEPRRTTGWLCLGPAPRTGRAEPLSVKLAKTICLPFGRSGLVRRPCARSRPNWMRKASERLEPAAGLPQWCGMP